MCPGQDRTFQASCPPFKHRNSDFFVFNQLKMIKCYDVCKRSRQELQKITYRPVLKPNSWTYKVSGHNLEISQIWGFCMDFLNHWEGWMVFYQVFLLSPFSEIVRGGVSLRKYKSQGKAVEVTVNDCEGGKLWRLLDSIHCVRTWNKTVPCCWIFYTSHRIFMKVSA